MMKKLLTLFVAGLVVAPSFAQYKRTLVSTDRQEKVSTPALFNAPAARTGNTNTGNKGTGITTGWMNYAESMYLPSFSSLTTMYIYQDSNLVFSNGNHSFYFGYGFSFDPTSVGFGADNMNPAAKPPFTVTATNAYTVDSIEVMGFYNRVNNAAVDTLYIEVAAVGATYPGTFTLQTAKDPAGNQSSDSIERFCTGIYDPIRNRMSDSVTGKQVITKVLNAAAFADSIMYSDLGGMHRWKFKLPNALSLAAGQRVIAYAHFVSGVAQPLNTPFENSNVWFHAVNEPQGADLPMSQKNKEVTSGLLMTTEVRWENPGASSFQGHHILFPTLFYNATANFDYPWFGFHVSCPTCTSTGVGNIGGTVKLGNVFPNPANNTITMPISMKEKANVNVSLSNMMGQTLSTQNLGQLAASQTTSATFSTTNLANGVYFLTVEANGARSTSRFVVAH